MRWMEIRAYFAVVYAQAQANGVTQQAIADRGGIAGQNSVSRLLSNDRLGPSVEIFVRAVEGLGLSLSEFFAEFEKSFATQIEAASQAAAVAASSNGRASHGRSSLSDGLTQADTASLDQPPIQPLLRAATQGILARLDRIDAQVEALGGHDGNVPARKPATRRTHRRRTANLT
jgi:transcriptional regulator with XRE-family HTH domain